MALGVRTSGAAASEVRSEIVLARAPSPADATVAFVRGKQEKYSDVADVDGSNVCQLTRGPGFKYDPDWSPDGRRLLYRYEPPSGLARYPKVWLS